MKTVLMDDEILAVNMLEYMLKKVPDVELTGSFTAPEKCLEYLTDNDADLIFLDIEMPGMSGIDMARKIRDTMQHPPLIIFVTAYSQYSLDAWDVDAVDYILKPFEFEKICRALDKARKLLPSRQETPVYFRCFPSFELLLSGQPYAFRNKKAKELLAYMVHSNGSWCDNNEVIFALFEDLDEDAGKNYLRQVMYRLRTELKALGLGGIIESDYGKCRVNIGSYPCDYYEYLNGKESLFRGEYMKEYSWAEYASATMLAKMKK